MDKEPLVVAVDQRIRLVEGPVGLEDPVGLEEGRERRRAVAAFVVVDKGMGELAVAVEGRASTEHIKLRQAKTVR
ncbi:unnamed protein product [Bursaphelenchus xylophilus]|uniref:(pine wood nematode) hypothetical protein n=1 Tax=Bursaphelenchus xylophilus TaxID=6326 RepID=A0A1I7SB92_BURXY|nr:unnamed protein product [Bursaphelenchus xylophilus]CAG9131999.1 unnamed protein product [Bursaphelenchus xylophilus]